MSALTQDQPRTGRERPHIPNAPILEVNHLTVRYGNRTALESISFELEKGEQVAVIGPNGAGKSTLLKAIAGVLSPTQGAVRIAGHEPGGHICIAYLPQRSQVDWSFPVTVEDVVLMGRVGRLGWFRKARPADREQVQECLHRVGLEHLARRQIEALSGGEQQRMFIARALAQEAELMLMDEVMTACDVPSQDEIYRLLEQLREQRVTIMVSTHDLDEAATRYDRVILLNRHLIGLGTAKQVFVPELLKAAYGSHLRVIPAAGEMLVINDTCTGEGGNRRA